MTQFHAVILDECGNEFGVTVNAPTRSEAYDEVMDSYPENRGIVQMESPQDTQDREAAIRRSLYARLQAEQNGEFYGDY